ncbi:MAG: hypothetical protein OIF58_08945, partial [Cohaesibacter sp.]|nr:hypothetical protein [Cohaesibacter sp.]
ALVSGKDPLAVGEQELHWVWEEATKQDTENQTQPKQPSKPTTSKQQANQTKNKTKLTQVQVAKVKR